MNPTDETLSAYLDDELDADARAALESLLARDAAARERLQALSDSDARLRAAMPLGSAEADPLAALILGGTASAGRTPAPVMTMPRPALRRRRRLASVMAMAAGLGAIVLGQALLTRHDSGDAGAAAPWLQADSGWQAALDRQPSGVAGATRIELSFAAADGRHCRLFAQAGGEGLACRAATDTGWQVVAWDATAPQAGASDGYQPAGASAALDSAMNRLGGGDALAPEQERQLIERQWR